MPAMLRHKPTGDLYVFTSLMAQRDDMEYVDVPDIGPAEPAPVMPTPVPVIDKSKKPKGAAIKIDPAPPVVAPPEPVAPVVTAAMIAADAATIGDTLDALFAEGE